MKIKQLGFKLTDEQTKNKKKKKKWKKDGDAGDRTLYLSHAKRALYHLSYIPNLLLLRSFDQINILEK